MKTAKNPSILLVVMVAAAVSGCARDNTPPSTASASALPPKYLQVSQFQSCLESKQTGSYEQWCMPESKPDSCPAESWSQLGQLQGDDKVPACR